MDFVNLNFILGNHYCITYQKSSVIIFYSVPNACNNVLILDDSCNKEFLTHQNTEYENLIYFFIFRCQLHILLPKECIMCLQVYVVILLLVTTIYCAMTKIQDFVTDSF